MKTTNTLALGLVSLLLAGSGYGQTTNSTFPSARDNPGVLGTSYGDVSYEWQNARQGPDARDIALRGNAPVARGVDVGLGYDYDWANNNYNPFTSSSYDNHHHTLAANANFFAPSTSAPKPFLGIGVGYQWAYGDFPSLRTYNHQWLWDLAGGVEIPIATFAFTPHVMYTDSMQRATIGTWNYGGELHHWFSDTVGGYVDATFHDPDIGVGPESWSYTAGLRFRF